MSGDCFFKSSFCARAGCLCFQFHCSLPPLYGISGHGCVLVKPKNLRPQRAEMDGYQGPPSCCHYSVSSLEGGHCGHANKLILMECFSFF